MAGCGYSPWFQTCTVSSHAQLAIWPSLNMLKSHPTVNSVWCSKTCASFTEHQLQKWPGNEEKRPKSEQNRAETAPATGSWGSPYPTSASGCTFRPTEDESKVGAECAKMSRKTGLNAHRHVVRAGRNYTLLVRGAAHSADRVSVTVEDRQLHRPVIVIACNLSERRKKRPLKSQGTADCLVN